VNGTQFENSSFTVGGAGSRAYDEGHDRTFLAPWVWDPLNPAEDRCPTPECALRAGHPRALRHPGAAEIEARLGSHPAAVAPIATEAAEQRPEPTCCAGVRGCRCCEAEITVGLRAQLEAKAAEWESIVAEGVKLGDGGKLSYGRAILRCATELRAILRGEK
jgi:hypothetical protein